MPWARLDDGYFTNAKVAELSMEAKLLDLASIAFSARELRDGILSRVDVRIIAAQVGIEEPFGFVRELVSAGRWAMDGQRYLIHDYLKYNPSREQVLAERASNVERQSRWRQRHTVDDGNHNAVTNALVTPAPYPVPDPLTSGEVNPPAATQQVPPAVAAVIEPPGKSSFLPGEQETIDKASLILTPIGLDADPRFWRKVLDAYGGVDIEAEAIKIADWQRRHKKRQCSQRFVLNWLDRSGKEQPGEVNRNGIARHDDQRFAAFRKYA